MTDKHKFQIRAAAGDHFRAMRTLDRCEELWKAGNSATRSDTDLYADYCVAQAELQETQRRLELLVSGQWLDDPTDGTESAKNLPA